MSSLGDGNTAYSRASRGVRLLVVSPWLGSRLSARAFSSTVQSGHLSSGSKHPPGAFGFHLHQSAVLFSIPRVLVSSAQSTAEAVFPNDVGRHTGSSLLLYRSLACGKSQKVGVLDRALLLFSASVLSGSSLPLCVSSLSLLVYQKMEADFYFQAPTTYGMHSILRHSPPFPRSKHLKLHMYHSKNSSLARALKHTI